MANPVIESWTANNSGSSTVSSITLTKPSGVEVGDLLLVIVGSDWPNSNAWEVETGWTLELELGGPTPYADLGVYWRIADGSEGASVEIDHDGSANMYGWYIRISGIDTADPIHQTGTAAESSSTSALDITGVTITVSDCLIIYAIAFDGGDAGSFTPSNSGFSEVDEEYAGTASNEASGSWGYKNMSGTGASGTVTVTMEVSDGCVGIQIAIAPLPGVTIEPSSLDLTLGLQTPTILTDWTVKPPDQELSGSLLAPSLSYDLTFTVSAVTMAASVQAPAVNLDYTVEPSAIAGTLTLQAPVVDTSIVIFNATALSLTLAEQAPSVTLDYTVMPSAIAGVLSVQSPGFQFDIIASAAAVAAVLTLETPWIGQLYDEIPPVMQQDLIDPYSGGAWLWLCEIAVSGYSTQRLARNTEDITYGGESYDKFNVQISEQMFSGDGGVPRVTLRIFQDANRTIEDIVNATEGALGAEVKLIRVCEKFLDYPISALEADYENLAAESDSEWTTFTLGIPNPLTQRYPLRTYSSSSCPWATPTLFKGPECQYAGPDGTCTGTYEDCYQKGNAAHWGGELGLDPNVVRI